MKKYVYKDAFAVIGKAGSGPADKGPEWIAPLWPDAFKNLFEIAGIIRKTENGEVLWWGAMNDDEESNKRWGQTGKYMAGCEADVDVQPPDGWTKWVIPAQTYLVADATQATYGVVFGGITNDPKIKITGTVHERYPQPGNENVLELYFPVAEGMIFCQSCMMPMIKPEEFGKESDGTFSLDYCCYCYQDGSFTKEQTMEEMIETCIPFCRDIYESDEAARAAMMVSYPELKRWAK